MCRQGRNDFRAGNLLRQSVTEIFYTIQIALSNLDAWKLIALLIMVVGKNINQGRSWLFLFLSCRFLLPPSISVFFVFIYFISLALYTQKLLLLHPFSLSLPTGFCRVLELVAV